jgi:hypothetical protein
MCAKIEMMPLLRRIAAMTERIRRQNAGMMTGPVIRHSAAPVSRRDYPCNVAFSILAWPYMAMVRRILSDNSALSVPDGMGRR